MIIGLIGYAQSGKDTVAKILVDNYGFTRVAFADKIRELLHEVNPVVGTIRLNDIVDEYGWDIAKQKPEVRELLQNLGVGARKLFGDKFWVHQAIGSIAEAHPNIVVTDVRFTNEADTLKINGAQLWRIKRLGVGPVNSHVSEAQLDTYKVDQIFINNGTIGDLSALVKTRMVGLLV
jgi:hypothetical protein